VAAVPVMAQTTWYVDDDCQGPNYDGTQADPYCTIQAAIDASSAGDTIMVAAGTYDLTASIIVDKSVSLIGDISDPENVVINAGTIPMNSGPKPPDRDKDGFQVAANNVVIRGFKIVNALTVVGGAGDGWQNAGITVGGDITLLDWLDPWNEPLLIDGGTFSDNIIENCSHGIYLAMSKNIVVADNTLRNSTCVPGRESYDGEGIVNWNTKAWGTYQDPTGNVVEGNVIEDCERIGICLGAWGERFSVSGTVIRNNTIRNSQKWAGIALMYIDGPLTITGNDISDNPEGISILGGDAYCTNIAVNFNNIAGNTNHGVYNGGANVIDATNNWWGHASGPSGEYGRTNPAGKVIGKGDAVSDNVDWDPWLSHPIDLTPHVPVPPGPP
jgi:parallel beta-helix repeat protein